MGQRKYFICVTPPQIYKDLKHRVSRYLNNNPPVLKLLNVADWLPAASIRSPDVMWIQPAVHEDKAQRRKPADPTNSTTSSSIH